MSKPYSHASTHTPSSSSEARFLHLQSANNSLIVQLDPVPAIVYWGSQFNRDHALSQEMFDAPVGQARLDSHIPLALCPEQGRGDFGSPGIEGHRNGKDWGPVFQLTAVTDSLSSATLTLSDPRAALEINIYLELDEDTDVLMLKQQLINIGCNNYTVNRFALTLPFDETFSDIITFHGRWSHEFQTQRTPLEHSGFIQENRRGRTSHESFPGIIALPPSSNDLTGDVLGMHFGWSGNHRLQARVKSDGRRYLQAEALLAPGEVVLAPCESFETPTMYAVFTSHGLNSMMQKFHQYVRSSVLHFPQSMVRPVHFNTWEGMYFDHQPQRIMDMASAVARLGVERFILDDGWFLNRDGETRALGDWRVDKRKYPDGLKPVVDHINQLGMEFGLWVEPEMVSKDSIVFREHPDWMLGLDTLGYTQPSGRYQYVLDLQNLDAYHYLLVSLDTLLTEHNIAYLKWDMNRELVQAGHALSAAYHGQTLALYKLIDDLKARHPYVEIESCASGGGRIDYEVLKRTHRFWTSDCNDALERQTIQHGMQYFFPPEVMGSHIGPRQSHTTRRCHDMSFRGITALFGHMGAELDPVGLEDNELRAFARYIGLHKQYRPLLHHGNCFNLPSHDPNTRIHGVTDDTVTLLAVAQLAMPKYAQGGRLRLPVLCPDKRYRIDILDAPSAFSSTMKHKPAWMVKPLTFQGDQLIRIGLSLPIMDPESAMLLSFTLV
ncbi:alpha-galactosidase [Enterovibrio sp. ZSDZ42]|uniref:Alpha-galactosidase n=1 Tax=Enterovibrio gelatinilyticus TaxID=2899819 RepID=A0ABT5R4X2_9GAMM|nr:alpha-galactosidase [Enterovibrio sp. ZSDZ42]MDD1795324.1 alpha-galactosidase [Enterovibrio sp. ZSDZ42]